MLLSREVKQILKYNILHSSLILNQEEHCGDEMVLKSFIGGVSDMINKDVLSKNVVDIEDVNEED